MKNNIFNIAIKISLSIFIFTVSWTLGNAFTDTYRINNNPSICESGPDTCTNKKDMLCPTVDNPDGGEDLRQTCQKHKGAKKTITIGFRKEKIRNRIVRVPIQIVTDDYCSCQGVKAATTGPHGGKTKAPSTPSEPKSKNNTNMMDLFSY